MPPFGPVSGQFQLCFGTTEVRAKVGARKQGAETKKRKRQEDGGAEKDGGGGVGLPDPDTAERPAPKVADVRKGVADGKTADGKEEEEQSRPYDWGRVMEGTGYVHADGDADLEACCAVREDTVRHGPYGSSTQVELK